MFGSEILEIAIGLAFVYLLFSLVCTTLAEWIARILRLRASTLKSAIANMISEENEDASERNLVGKFYAHPLIKSLSKSSWYDELPVWRMSPAARHKIQKWGAIIFCVFFIVVLLFDGLFASMQTSLILITVVGGLGVFFIIAYFRLDQAHPSYIKPHTFVQILLDTTNKNTVGQSLTSALQTLQSQADVEAQRTAKESALKWREAQRGDTDLQSIVESINQAESPDLYQKEIEQWFEDVQERVNGWYTRKLGVIVLILACFVTFVFNLDTWAIANALSRDAQLRTAIVEQAQQFAVENSEITASTPLSTTMILRQLDNEIQGLGLPIGWVEATAPTTRPAASLIISKTPVSETTVVTVTTLITVTDAITLTPTTTVLPTNGITHTTAAWATSNITPTNNCTVTGVITVATVITTTTVFTPTSAVTLTASVTTTTDTMSTTPPLLVPLILTEIVSGTEAYRIAVADRRLWPQNPVDWGYKLPGFLLTILALSLGAPFWFDTLNKIANLRSSGKPPGETESNSQNDS